MICSFEEHVPSRNIDIFFKFDDEWKKARTWTYDPNLRKGWFSIDGDATPYPISELTEWKAAGGVFVMRDLRNGIFPVIVTPETETDFDDVDSIYPFGCEEYTGPAMWGRFEMLSSEEATTSLIKEIIRLRKALKHLTGATDKNLCDVCYDMKPWAGGIQYGC